MTKTTSHQSSHRTSTPRPTKKPASSHAAPALRSFHRSPNPPFLRYQLTRQTLYWSLISLLIIVLGIWIINATIQINGLYDTVDTDNTTAPHNLPLTRFLPKKH